MAQTSNYSAAMPAAPAARGLWAVSLPLVVAAVVYLLALLNASHLLLDGDTFSHIAIGRWILEHGVVPTVDPMSHTKLGTPWTAFEWLSQVLLAAAYALGAWGGVIALTSACYALCIALLTRELLRTLDPLYVILFAGLAVALSLDHLLARPHILAMPLLIAWTIGLVRAREAGGTPSYWFLPLMVVWANLHGGFTLGLALACAFALEAVLEARNTGRMWPAARAWGIFIVLALLASFLTPHGPRGLMVTWQTLVQDSYALSRIGEWQSPDFHTLIPMELWLLGLIALAFSQGLRLPPMRLVLLLGMIHLALKHVRYVEFLGLLVPLFVAQPLAAQWRQRRAAPDAPSSLDLALARAAGPAGPGALLACFALVAAMSSAIFQARPPELGSFSAPVNALKAARDLHLKGPVLNSYSWGGYLMFEGVAPYIDGRSDMYRDEFIREYLSAMELQEPGSLEKVLEKYHIGWTMLKAYVPAVKLLDQMPGWKRVYTDQDVVIHTRVAP